MKKKLKFPYSHKTSQEFCLQSDNNYLKNSRFQKTRKLLLLK